MKRRRILYLLPVLAAGIAAVELWPDRGYAKPACWDDIPGLLPQKHTSTPYTLTDFVLASKHVPGPVRYTIASPAIVFDPEKRKGPNAPTAVLCLPGRGSTGRSVFDELELHRTAAEVVPPTQHTLFIGVDGGDSYWHERASGEDRMRMLLEELVPFVERTFDLRVRATMGWSMGGYGALLAASRLPDRFVTAAVQSPALFQSYDAMRAAVPDAFDTSIDFVDNDLFKKPAGLVGKPLWIACGDGDPFAPAVAAFAPPRADVTRVAVPGCHDAGFWREHLAEQVRYVAARVA